MTPEDFEKMQKLSKRASLEEKLAKPKDSGGTKARCTTEQLRQRFGGVVISLDGKTAKVTSMQVSKWVLVGKDVWEKIE